MFTHKPCNHCSNSYYNSGQSSAARNWKMNLLIKGHLYRPSDGYITPFQMSYCITRSNNSDNITGTFGSIVMSDGVFSVYIDSVTVTSFSFDWYPCITTEQIIHK